MPTDIILFVQRAWLDKLLFAKIKNSVQKSGYISLSITIFNDILAYWDKISDFEDNIKIDYSEYYFAN